MKNRAIDRTSEIFNADQVSMCRSCSRARRGPRPPSRDDRPLPFALVVTLGSPLDRPSPGASGGSVLTIDVAPAGDPTGWAGTAPVPAARGVPAPGIDWVDEAGSGWPGTDSFGTAPSPRAPVRTELGV